MTMLGNSDIDTDTETDGNAGEVTIHAGALTINGEGDPSAYTGISSDALDDNDDAANYNTGTAGSVGITVKGELIMLGSAEINTDTYTYGNAGDLTIHAGAMLMDGTSEPDYITNVTSESDGIDSSTANSGRVTVAVNGLLTLLGNSEIDTDTYSCGNAGTVTIQANDLNINGAATAADQDFTGISSDALDGNDDAAVNNTGNAGDVDVNVRDFLSIGGSGVIAAQTYTAGTGGDINVHAGAIDLEDSAAPQMLDGIGANAFAAGKGGQITIAAGNLAISTTAEIDSSSEISNAGDIIIKVANLSLTSGGEISTSAGNDGGSITINAGNLFYLDDGTIESSASGGATTKGGNITIDPVLLVLADGTISASDPDGSGGKISIVADNYFNQTMIITATGGVSNGAISISAPDLNLSGSLLLLPQELESDENKLKESCVRSVNREFSSLVVVGRGGTELAPDELQPDFGVGR
jgi:large exoprotein involved in heme utilization and adhesion